MKSLTIKSVRGKNTVASLVAKKVEGALSIFSEAPTVEIKELCEAYTIIRIYPEKASILTFAEIDTVREAVDVYKNKYEYGCVSRPGCLSPAWRFR